MSYRYPTPVAPYAGITSRAGHCWRGPLRSAFIRGVADYTEGSPRDPVPYPLQDKGGDDPGGGDGRKGWLFTWRLARLDGWDSAEAQHGDA